MEKRAPNRPTDTELRILGVLRDLGATTQRQLLRDLMDRAFGGSASALVLHARRVGIS